MGDRAMLPRAEREAMRRIFRDLVSQLGSQSAVGVKLGISQQAVNKALRFAEVGPIVQRRVFEYLGIRTTEFPMKYRDGMWLSIFGAVKTVLDAADPMHLLAMGAPSDEYVPEVEDIANRVFSGEHVDGASLHDIFEHWFGVRLATGQTQQYWGELASRVRDSVASTRAERFVK